jgi:predicted ester cyclase
VTRSPSEPDHGHGAAEELLIRANQQVLGHFDLDAIPRYFGPDCLIHHGSQMQLCGHDEIRSALHRLSQAFPSLQMRIEVLAREGLRLAWRRQLQGIQRGHFAGFEPRGQTVSWCELGVTELRHGLIVEEWVSSDLAEQLLRARKPN